jgi:hypothetical protein
LLASFAARKKKSKIWIDKIYKNANEVINAFHCSTIVWLKEMGPIFFLFWSIHQYCSLRDTGRWNHAYRHGNIPRREILRKRNAAITPRLEIEVKYFDDQFRQLYENSLRISEAEWQNIYNMVIYESFERLFGIPLRCLQPIWESTIFFRMDFKKEIPIQKSTFCSSDNSFRNRFCFFSH